MMRLAECERVKCTTRGIGLSQMSLGRMSTLTAKQFTRIVLEDDFWVVGTMYGFAQTDQITAIATV